MIQLHVGYGDTTYKENLKVLNRHGQILIWRIQKKLRKEDQNSTLVRTKWNGLLDEGKTHLFADVMKPNLKINNHQYE